MGYVREKHEKKKKRRGETDMKQSHRQDSTAGPA